MQCHEIFQVLISIVSLSLSSAHVLHISRSQSQIIFQPRLLLVLGIKKIPKHMRSPFQSHNCDTRDTEIRTTNLLRGFGGRNFSLVVVTLSPLFSGRASPCSPSSLANLLTSWMKKKWMKKKHAKEPPATAAGV